MYRPYRILLALLFLSPLAKSQEYKYEVGLELGPSRTFLTGNSFIEEYHDATLGFSGGFSFQGNISEHFSWRTGFGFERKGSQAKFDGIDLNGNLIHEIQFYNYYDYFTLPLIIKYSFGQEVKFYANAGMYYAFLNNAFYIVEAFEDNPRTEYDQKKYTNETDYGIVLGLGAMIPMGPQLGFTIEARHNKGLTNTSSVRLADEGEINMNSTNLLLGIAYKFGSNPIILPD